MGLLIFLRFSDCDINICKIKFQYCVFMMQLEKNGGLFLACLGLVTQNTSFYCHLASSTIFKETKGRPQSLLYFHCINCQHNYEKCNSCSNIILWNCKYWYCKWLCIIIVNKIIYEEWCEEFIFKYFWDFFHCMKSIYLKYM